MSRQLRLSPTQEVGKDRGEKGEKGDEEDKGDKGDKEDKEDKEGKEGKQDVAKAFGEVVPGKEPRRKSGKTAAEKAKKKKRSDATKTNPKDAEVSGKKVATAEEQAEVEEGKGEKKTGHRLAKKIQRPGFFG